MHALQLPRLKLYVLTQRTSSTANIISSWAGPGLLTLGLRGGRHCESNHMHAYDGEEKKVFDFEKRKGGWLTYKCIYSVNWYQRKYRFCWAGARLVRDD